jgi:hypothetical protein
MRLNYLDLGPPQEERPHEALGYRTPHEVYFGTRATLVPASEAVV